MKNRKNIKNIENIGREVRMGKNPTTTHSPGETPAALAAPTENRTMAIPTALLYYFGACRVTSPFAARSLNSI